MESSQTTTEGSQQEWIPLRRCAARCGRSLGAVQKAVKTGRIPASAVRRREDGRILAVEVHAAARAWLANSDPGRAERAAPPLTLTAPGPAPAIEGAAEKSADPHGYYGHRARREALEVQLRELELAERAGKLVNKAGVEAAARQAGRALREALVEQPARVGPLLAYKSQDEVVLILDRENGRLIAQLVDRLHELAGADLGEEKQ